MLIRKATLLTMALVSLGLAACASGFKASYDADPAHDFSGYQTYAWISKNPMIVGSTNRMPNPLLEPRIMAAIEDGMTVRGFRKVDDPESADFTLSFTVGSREEIKVNSYPASYQGFYGHPRSAYWQYQKGMLALDVFDVKEHRPVYHSVAEKSITDSDRKKMDETINAAVAAVLQAFPPQ